MQNSFNAMTDRYIVGFDLGNYSVGMTAMSVDDDGVPVEILEAVSHIHDGGVGEAQNKNSRRMVAGVARRARRRLRHVRDAEKSVDSWLAEHMLGDGVDRVDMSVDPWEARTRLVAGVIADDIEVRRLVARAVQHISRHRGWRNPWVGVDHLLRATGPSDSYTTLVEHVREQCSGAVIPDDPTPGQLGFAADRWADRTKLRGNALTVEARRIVAKTGYGTVKEDVRAKVGLLSAYKINQSDNVRELRRIFEVQGLSDRFENVVLSDLVELVFHQIDPKGSAADGVGDDALVPGRRRAWRADLDFQAYRIAAQLGNVRVRTGKGRNDRRRLTDAERSVLFTKLNQWTSGTAPTWRGLCKTAGLPEGTLIAPTDRPDDGEDTTGRPLVNETHRVLSVLGTGKTSGLGVIRDLYWSFTDDQRRVLLVHLFSNAEKVGESEVGAATVAQIDGVLSGLDDEAIEQLDAVKLASGRGAYSAQTCREITEQIVTTEDDVHDARRALYGILADWSPRAVYLLVPTGNAAVDRSLRQVHRMLTGLERRYGTPAKIVVENGRDGLTSAKTKDERDTEARKKGTARDKRSGEVCRAFGLAEGSRLSMAQVWKYECVTRQNGLCFYCGHALVKTGGFYDWDNIELDHIVPRSGPGSTTTRENIVAACTRCNGAKLNQVAKTWIDSCGLANVSEKEIVDRVNHWTCDPGVKAVTHSKLKQAVISRVKQTVPDEAIDNRSIESTSWMATEVRRRLIQRYEDAGETVPVLTFSGSTTAEARRTWVAGGDSESGVSVNSMVHMIGGTGKQRLDRRHHALDAAVIAVMDLGPAQVLAERRALRADARLGMSQAKSGDPVTGIVAKRWVEYTGGDHTKTQAAYKWWCTRMIRVIALFDEALQSSVDDVAVTRNLRVRLGDGETHKATVRSVSGVTKKLGDAWTRREIMDAGLPGLTEALCGLPDYHAVPEKPGHHKDTGLKTNKERTVVVNGVTYGADAEFTVSLTDSLMVGKKWTLDNLARIADPRVYTAMIRSAGMDWVGVSKGKDRRDAGLPADKHRTLNIQGHTLGPKDRIDVLPEQGIPVRGGYVTTGTAWHHLRFYRCVGDDGRTGLYQETVYAHDLLSKHTRNRDLLTVPLPEASLSRRGGTGQYATGQTNVGVLREMVCSGDAEFVGSVLSGDELLLSETDVRSLMEKGGVLGDGLSDFFDLTGGVITRWQVVGSSDNRLQITPYTLASEGVRENDRPDQVADRDTESVFKDDPAAALWFKKNGKSAQHYVRLSAFAGMEHVRVIRRTTFGEIIPEESTGRRLTSFTLVDNRRK